MRRCSRHLARTRTVRPAFGQHPRLAILGPQEARLLSFDLVILGGLNEGTWPQAAQADPWFSRPMRKMLGLEQPERAIGLAAHDFATLAAGPRCPPHPRDESRGRADHRVALGAAADAIDERARARGRR